MEQHPVPRNITGFQFHLIGDMTVKQFGYLLICGLISFIFFRIPLPQFLSWPVAIASALLGIGLAFVPIQERPLDRWIVAFIKTVYSPTQFLWHKNNFAPDVLLARAVVQTQKTTPLAGKHLSHYEDSRRKLQAYLSTIKKTPRQSIDTEETKHLASTLALFRTPSSFPQSTMPFLRTQTMPPVSSIETRSVAPAHPSPAPQPVQPISPPVVTTPAPPTTPTLQQTPNMITGSIKDKTHNPLPNILVTIKDKDGTPLRALKSTTHGAFAASTALPDGTYTVEFEDPLKRYSFAIIEEVLSGIPVVPLDIIAKNEKELNRERLMKEIFGKTF